MGNIYYYYRLIDARIFAVTCFISDSPHQEFDTVGVGLYVHAKLSTPFIVMIGSIQFLAGNKKAILFSNPNLQVLRLIETKGIY